MNNNTPLQWGALEQKEFDRQWEILSFGVVEITPVEEFKQMLKNSILNKKPLRIKCGIDPTGSDVHLGHLVPYKKMRQFQDLGHIGVVIIGDYTACIGDPTGKAETRQAISEEIVKLNAKRYMEQVYTVLDKKRTEVCYQSEWFAKADLSTVIHWAAQTTVAKLLSHDTFRVRLESGQGLSLHELFYPMLQGIDSVFVKADVELGGSDQKFNVLMGRDYQKNAEMRPQVAMLLPIITGLCGTLKMSKSLGNYIGILDEPFDKFGKVMSIPDKLMLEYYQYVAGVTEKEFKEISQKITSGAWHPNEAKKELAQKIVAFFHGEELGIEMRQKFEDVFKKGQVPDDAPTYSLKGGEILTSLLLDLSLLESKGEIRRLAKQGAISVVDGLKIDNSDITLDLSWQGKTIKIGKRKFLKLI